MTNVGEEFETEQPPVERRRKESRKPENCAYTFYIRLPQQTENKELRLASTETLQFVIQKLINFDQPRLKDLSESDNVVYFADDDGNPEMDISSVD